MNKLSSISFNCVTEIHSILLLTVLVFLNACADSTPINPTGALSPPLGLQAVTNTAEDSIQLTFYSANNEEDFDGFNIYISESENVADTSDGRIALLPDGTEPTFQLSPNDYDSNQLRTYEVRYRDSNRSPLSAGVTYFFIVRAHSSQGRVSPPSNEASAVAP